MSAPPLALALDLGTTRIKAGLLDSRGRIARVESAPAPPLTRHGPSCEGDAGAYVERAIEVLGHVCAELPAGFPLGLASQRSTFTLWEASTLRARAPLVSWQDRRAESWCAAHAALASRVGELCGLPLSPHYAGPKLAWLRGARPDLWRGLAAGELEFGTLDTYFLACCGAARRTDLTVASRSLLVDLARQDWSPELLEAFGVPARAVPPITGTVGLEVALRPGPRLRAAVSDQAAAALALLPRDPRTALVNAGTGAFVLRATASAVERRAGYLIGPLLPGTPERAAFALEGPINGSAAAIDRFAPGPTELPEADPAPEAFALPDLSGTGAPHWRPDLGLVLSPAARRLSPAARRRVVVEGLLFRVREILDGLFEGEPPERIVLAGGSSRDPGLPAGLAALAGAPVCCAAEPEAGLAGAARLAAGLDPAAGAEFVPVPAGASGAYLREKYARWKIWMHSLLGASSGGGHTG